MKRILLYTVISLLISSNIAFSAKLCAKDCTLRPKSEALKDYGAARKPYVAKRTYGFSTSVETFDMILEWCAEIAREIRRYYGHEIESAMLAYMMKEAVHNVIVHAHMDKGVLDTSKKIILRYEVSRDYIIIEVEDQGSKEFSPEEYIYMKPWRHFLSAAEALPKGILYSVLPTRLIMQVKEHYGLHLAVYQMGRYFDSVTYKPHYTDGIKTGGTLRLLFDHRIQTSPMASALKRKRRATMRRNRMTSAARHGTLIFHENALSLRVITALGRSRHSALTAKTIDSAS